jgi:hypothetical protein
MDLWAALNYGAWTASATLLLWMIVDAVRVGRAFDEEVLLSSEEGHDELLRAETTTVREDRR